MLGTQSYFLDIFYRIIPGNKSSDGPILVFLGYILCLPLTVIIFWLIKKSFPQKHYMKLFASLTGIILMALIGFFSAKLAIIP